MREIFALFWITKLSRLLMKGKLPLTLDTVEAMQRLTTELWPEYCETNFSALLEIQEQKMQSERRQQWKTLARDAPESGS